MASNQTPSPITREEIADLFAQTHARLVRQLAQWSRLPSTDPRAEEAVMEAWTRLILQADRGRAVSHPEGWMRTTTRRELLRLFGREDADTVAIDDEAHQPATEQFADRLDARRTLASMEHLRERDRRVMKASAAGFTYQEIADGLGISTTRVDHLLVRGRRKLRDEDA